jgi:hypothetical protein
LICHPRLVDLRDDRHADDPRQKAHDEHDRHDLDQGEGVFAPGRPPEARGDPSPGRLAPGLRASHRDVQGMHVRFSCHSVIGWRW